MSLTQIEKYSERGQILKDPPGSWGPWCMSRTVRSEVDFFLFIIYNFCFALFFPLTVGVRSQKTRLSCAARRARSSAGLRSENFPREVGEKKARREGDLCPILPIFIVYRRIPQAGSFTWRELLQKLETQNQKEDQISIRTTPDNAESEVFSDSRRFFS